MSSKKIVVISTYIEGGAGITASELNHCLNNSGYQSVHVIKRNDSKNSFQNLIVADKILQPSKYSLQWIIYKLNQKFKKHFNKYRVYATNPKYHFYNLDERLSFISARELIKILPFKPDFIFAYWISDFINMKIINQIQKMTGAVVFIRMADNSPLTGGCHYPWECTGFHFDCKNCPAIIDPKYKIIASSNLRYKKIHIPENTVLLAGSEMDRKRALQSSLYKNKHIEKLMSFVDENKFFPVEKNKAKSFFNLNMEQKAIAVTLSKGDSERKGNRIISQIVTTMEEYFIRNNIILLIAGNSEIKSFDKTFCRQLGFLDEQALIKVYQASEIFISASLEDSGPTTVRQSLMCGTPVVAFKIGVAIDLLKPGTTGYLASPGDINEMISGIKFILELSESDRSTMSSNCRKVAIENYSRESFIYHIERILQKPYK